MSDQLPQNPLTVHSYSSLVQAIGQMSVTLAFVGVTILLFVANRDVPPELWTLDVAIVSYYLGQRVPMPSGSK